MGFKDFLFRGNLIQLAVAVVIGTAFANVIKALTEGMITPLLGIFGGTPRFSDLVFEVNSSQFRWGWVVDTLITFLLTALILYYLVIAPSDWVMSKIQKKEEDKTRGCPECCSKIDKQAKKCAFCTSSVQPIPPQMEAEEAEKGDEKEKGEGDAMMA